MVSIRQLQTLQNQAQTARQQAQIQLQNVEQNLKQAQQRSTQLEQTYKDIRYPKKRPTPKSLQSLPAYTRQLRESGRQFVTEKLPIARKQLSEFFTEAKKAKSQIQSYLGEMSSYEQNIKQTIEKQQAVEQYEALRLSGKLTRDPTLAHRIGGDVAKIHKTSLAAFRSQLVKLQKESPNIKKIIADYGRLEIKGFEADLGQGVQSFGVKQYQKEVDKINEKTRKTLEDYYKMSIPEITPELIAKYNKAIEFQQKYMTGVPPTDIRTWQQKIPDEAQRVIRTKIDYITNIPRRIENFTKDLPEETKRLAKAEYWKAVYVFSQDQQKKNYAVIQMNKYATAKELSKFERKTAITSTTAALALLGYYTTAIGILFSKPIAEAAQYPKTFFPKPITYAGGLVSGLYDVATVGVPSVGAAYLTELGKTAITKPEVLTEETRRLVTTRAGLGQLTGWLTGPKVIQVIKTKTIHLYDVARGQAVPLKVGKIGRETFSYIDIKLPTGKINRAIIVPKTPKVPIIEQIAQANAARGIQTTIHVAPDIIKLKGREFTVGVDRGLYTSVMKQITEKGRVQQYPQILTEYAQSLGRNRIGIMEFLYKTIVKNEKLKISSEPSKPQIYTILEKSPRTPNWIKDGLSGKYLRYSKEINYWSKKFDIANEGKFCEFQGKKLTTAQWLDLYLGQGIKKPTAIQIKFAKAVIQWSRETKIGLVGGPELQLGLRRYGLEEQIIQPLGKQFVQIGKTYFTYIKGERVPIRFFKTVDPKTGKIEIVKLEGYTGRGKKLTPKEISELPIRTRGLTDIKTNDKLPGMLTPSVSAGTMTSLLTKQKIPSKIQEVIPEVRPREVSLRPPTVRLQSDFLIRRTPERPRIREYPRIPDRLRTPVRDMNRMLIRQPPRIPPRVPERPRVPLRVPPRIPSRIPPRKPPRVPPRVPSRIPPRQPPFRFFPKIQRIKRKKKKKEEIEKYVGYRRRPTVTQLSFKLFDPRARRKPLSKLIGWEKER